MRRNVNCRVTQAAPDIHGISIQDIHTSNPHPIHIHIHRLSNGHPLDIHMDVQWTSYSYDIYVVEGQLDQQGTSHGYSIDFRSLAIVVTQLDFVKTASRIYGTPAALIPTDVRTRGNATLTLCTICGNVCRTNSSRSSPLQLQPNTE